IAVNPHAEEHGCSRRCTRETLWRLFACEQRRSAAFFPLQGVGNGLLESHRSALAQRLLPCFLTNTCAHDGDASVSLGEEVGVSWNVLCFVKGLRCSPQLRRPFHFSFCSSHAGKSLQGALDD